VAKWAVLASGNGSNFEALSKALANRRPSCLICDRSGAFVFERAKRLRIPSHLVSYAKRDRAEAESEIIAILNKCGVDLVVLAGFMKILSPLFVNAFPSRIVNIHPALLPLHPGAHGLEESLQSGDRELGITIHYVDYGTDSGPVIMQKSFTRTGKESLEEIESRIHALEHLYYPEVIGNILDALDRNPKGVSA
jgi:phosphoribosylglycinamide formyltransferase 1